MTTSNLQLGRSCKTEERRAKLSSDFAISLLKKKVSVERFEDIMALLPVLKSGPNKGLPKGDIVWTKVLEGGFDYSKGRVLRGGCVDFYIEWECDGKINRTGVTTQNKSEEEAMLEWIPIWEKRLKVIEAEIDQPISDWSEDPEMYNWCVERKLELRAERDELLTKISNIRG